MLFIQNSWQNTASSLNRQPQRAGKDLSHGNCFEVQKVKPRMTLRDSSHARHEWPRVWEQDVAAQFKEAQDGPLLVCLLQLFERSRQMPSCSKNGRATCPVVPVESGVHDNRLVPAETDQQLFDQQPIVDDDQARG